MIRALLLANATAVLVLVGAQFMPKAEVRATAQIAPSAHLPQQKAQRALMSERSLNVAERNAPAALSPNLVF